MLSKEEIEKAREVCIKLIVYLPNVHLGGSEDIKILLQYIDQLEQENKTLKYTNKSYKGIINKQSKIIDEMAEWIFERDFEENSLLITKKDTYKKCIEQVKQYFEKKVEEK